MEAKIEKRRIERMSEESGSSIAEEQRVAKKQKINKWAEETGKSR